MPDYCFISYSRNEITFVDSFSKSLEKHGVNVWLDYRNLVPGENWQDQIFSAIDNAGKFLLVVSSASLSSPAVNAEINSALEKKKRIILIIFDPQPLDSRIAQCEWIDFNMPFNKSIDSLCSILGKPASKSNVNCFAPSKRVNFPPIIMTFYWLSIITCIGSLLMSAPLFFVPYILVPLPEKFKQREYEIEKLFLSLAILATVSFVIAAYFGGLFSLQKDLQLFQWVITAFAIIVCFSSLSLIGLLKFSASIYRWAGPGGARISSQPHLPKPFPSFIASKISLDYASEDSAIGEEIQKRIENIGHKFVQDFKDADIVLILLSRFKSTSSVNLEARKAMVIVLEDCTVDLQFEKLQYIDFRHGLGQLDNLVRLLGYPDLILPAFGVLPTRTVVRPLLINFILLWLGCSSIASCWQIFISFFPVNIFPLNILFGQGDRGQVLLSFIALIIGIVVIRRIKNREYINRLILVISFWIVGSRMGLFAMCFSLPIILLTIFSKEISFWIPRKSGV